MQRIDSAGSNRIPHSDPGLFRRVFGDVRYAPVWLLIRVYVGWVWINVGWSMVQSSQWMRDGTALRTAWERSSSTGQWPSSEYGLWASMTQFLIDTGAVDWIGRLTAVGMTVIGIALILGIGSGLASFFGVMLSANVMIAGSIVVDPLILGLAMTIVLAWKTAGWIGLDRWALPLLGAPWSSGLVIVQDASGTGQQEVSLRATK